MFFRRLSMIHCILIVIASCVPVNPQPSLQARFYVYRFSPPAFVEFNQDFQILREVPFSAPPNCTLLNTFSALVGEFLAVELSCPNGQTVLFWNTNTDLMTQPIKDSDSHFLAWTSDGRTAFLKVD